MTEHSQNTSMALRKCNYLKKKGFFSEFQWILNRCEFFSIKVCASPVTGTSNKFLWIPGREIHG